MTLAVVAGILNVLQIESAIHSAPKVGGVVALEDIFAAVGKVSITQKKAQAAELQILGMLGDIPLVTNASPTLS